MATVKIFFLCSFIVLFAQGEWTSKDEKPWIRVKLSGSVKLKCCYKDTVNPSQVVSITWVKHTKNRINRTFVILDNNHKMDEYNCGTLSFTSVNLNDSGLYQCHMNNTYTPGTYLQVYKPMEKTINLSESTKNRILTFEGILLLLCVLVPSATLLRKSKKLYELEKKKVQKEEENIYQGLNLDDCCNTTYDQIERSQAHDPYQDVGNIMEEAEIQLEKP